MSSQGCVGKESFSSFLSFSFLLLPAALSFYMFHLTPFIFCLIFINIIIREERWNGNGNRGKKGVRKEEKRRRGEEEKRKG
jgi:hypothetical protein